MVLVSKHSRTARTRIFEHELDRLSDTSKRKNSPIQTINHNLPAGARLLLNFSTASRDPTIFPDPQTVRLDPPLNSYIYYGWGPYQCLGMEASPAGLTAMSKSIVGLKGLRRAPGPRGYIKNVNVRCWNGQVRAGKTAAKEETLGRLRGYMTADQSLLLGLPTSMRVRWDAGNVGPRCKRI